MAELVRHRLTKGSVTDRLHLNHRATPRLHNGFALGGSRLTSCSIRRGIFDCPHASAPAAHEHRSAIDFDWRPGNAVIARSTATVRTILSRPIVEVEEAAASRARTFTTDLLLVCRHDRIDWMAPSGCIYARTAI